jgi:hypothetical protein
LYTLPGSVQLEADPTVSPDRDWLGIFAVVHCAVNQVALLRLADTYSNSHLFYTLQGTNKPLAYPAVFAFVPYALNHMFVLKLLLIV